ncbi:hypothetical protein K440DRAFT_633810 [Wilcoxina mikolae CBS 423.85]|nr:hypothetical protein K440DRAFT_633810 [Wilcoxina mikolae CBS 423.85]
MGQRFLPLHLISVNGVVALSSSSSPSRSEDPPYHDNHFTEIETLPSRDGGLQHGFTFICRNQGGLKGRGG